MSASDRQHQLRWLALLVLGLGMFIGVVDSSVMNVTTPAMQEEFSATESQMLMLVTIYSLVFASLLRLFGKSGGKFGLRRLQVVGCGCRAFWALLSADRASLSTTTTLAPSIGFVNGMPVLAGLAAAMGGAFWHSIDS